MSEVTLFEVVITAIIYDSDKYLLTRRAATKKRFPGSYTVPGGHLEPKDFLDLPKDTEHYWYNVLERALAREIEEEVGIAVDDVEYLTSLGTVHADGAPSIVISCIARYVSGEVKLDPAESDHSTWATVDEAEKLPLIDGIYDELVMVRARRNGEKMRWHRADTEHSK